MRTELRFQPSRVKEGLQTKSIGRVLLFFRELTSTNDMAKELALIGSREGIAVVAETQKRGRGRLGRRWISPHGGLWFSIILRPKTVAKHAPKLILTASVAVARTINHLFPLKAEIKWPNDVLINGRKVCGILTEVRMSGENLDFVVLGVGLNANFDLSALPDYLRGSSTTLREELGKEVDRENLLCALLEEFEFQYFLFAEGKFDSVLAEWRRLAGFLGSYVRVTSRREKVEGWATDVDQDGALIIRLRDHTTRRVTFGDLTVKKHGQTVPR